MDKLRQFLFRAKSRSSIANLLVFSFILFTGIGTFLINPAVGFITVGVTCGAVGYLLGME